MLCWLTKLSIWTGGFDSAILRREKQMEQMIKVLQWILGIVAGLSLILGVIFKLAHIVVLTAAPISFLRFTATCCLASIALSMIELSRKQAQ